MAGVGERDLVRLSGLWLRRKRDGEEYYSGAVSRTLNAYLFRGKERGNNGPPWILYVGPSPEPGDEADIDREERPWDAV